MSQELLVLIKVDESSEWQEWLIDGIYVLNEKTRKATHLGGVGLENRAEPMPKTIESKKLVKSLMKEGESCLHEHLSCPGDITTIKCAVCGKSMYEQNKSNT